MTRVVVYYGRGISIKCGEMPTSKPLKAHIILNVRMLDCVPDSLYSPVRWRPRAGPCWSAAGVPPSS